MKIFFGAIGAMIATGIVSAIGVITPLSMFQGGAIKALAAGVGLGCGWLVHGMIEERQERARIERELEQDRIRYEQERNKRQS